MLKNAQKDFIQRHIGPSEQEQETMLQELGYKSLDEQKKKKKPQKKKKAPEAHRRGRLRCPSRRRNRMKCSSDAVSPRGRAQTTTRRRSLGLARHPLERAWIFSHAMNLLIDIQQKTSMKL